MADKLRKINSFSHGADTNKFLVSKLMFMRLPNLLVPTEFIKDWWPSWKSNMAAKKLHFWCKINCTRCRNMILVSRAMFMRVPIYWCWQISALGSGHLCKTNMAATKLNFEHKITFSSDRKAMLVSVPIFWGMSSQKWVLNVTCLSIQYGQSFIFT